MGMWINLTKKPMKPMIMKPMAVAIAIFMNSAKMNKKSKNGCNRHVALIDALYATIFNNRNFSRDGE